MSDKKLYSTAVLLAKADNSAFRLVNGYSVSVSEDEAKGRLVATALNDYSGYRVTDVLCMQIEDDSIELVMPIQNVQAADETK